MKHSLFTRLLSLFLAFALVVPCFPQVTAEEIVSEIVETTEATEPVETTLAEETEATEATEATDAAEETEAPAISEETEATEAPTEETEATEAPVEETEPTEETEPAEETEATEPTEETEPAELPYGFLGMPEGYEISERNLERRSDMKEHKVLETMSGLTPGVDYVADQIKVAAATEEEALLIAEAYCGELTAYDNELALITLHDATAMEAVEASMNEELNLPAAAPNYTIQLEPIVSSAPVAFASEVPTEMDWSDWVYDVLGDNADPALMEPWSYTYQYVHDAIDTYAAWGVTTGRSDVKVAVVDSGVDTDHPDLNVTAYDVGYGTEDENGHGTHVCGIIAAELGNALGGAGVAPDITIGSFRCGDKDGGIDTYYGAQGIIEAAEWGADVINLSWGGYWYDVDVQDAINYATNVWGVTVVAAMGNDGSNTVCYPAACDNVIAVGATDRSNRRAWYSNYGAWCDVSAPGSDIYSTYYDGDYTWMDGTSMAAPVVTAVCALYMSWFGTVSPKTMEKVLESSCVKCSDSGMGAGIVNVANMLDGKPIAPAYRITYTDESGTESTLYDYEEFDGSVLPCESRLYFATYGHDDAWYILYTLDGKTPSVKNGQIVNGTQYVGGGIDLSAYAGGSVTLKAVQVSGMGVPGKVLTLKLKVADSIQVDSVSISGPSLIVAGKSGQFTATVEPAEYADQGVIWRISSCDDSLSAAKITQKGVLSTPKNASGSITIEAESKANGNIVARKTVQVKIVNPVSKMKLDLSKATIYNGDTLALSIAQMVDAKGNSVMGYFDVSWTSSNTRVATVSSSGVVTAVGKGNATITCKALGGSNKTAKCTVTVKQQVTGITITGNSYINPGASTTLKANITPSNANSKAVEWSLGSYVAGVSISTSGKLKVASYVAPNTKITVRATSKDGFGATDAHTVTVKAKLTSLTMTLNTAYEGLAAGAVYNRKGVLTTMNLFSVDMPESSYLDNYCDLWRTFTGPDTLAGTWSSSNTTVATVTNGYVTAHKAGTAKITYTALDGSNKKVSITVKVTNPVSYMEIKTSAPQMTNDTPYIGIGKSVNNSVYFGDTYGTVSNKKVKWDFELYEASYDGSLVSNWTSYVKSNKLITVSSSGKLTVKKGVYDIWNEYVDSTDGVWNELELYLYAYSTDGSGTMATKVFYVIQPTTYMQMEYKTYYCYANDGGVASFYSNQWHLFEDFYESGFIATSSNPKVASVIGIYPYDDGTYIYGDWYDCYFATGKKGTAKITIKATDGSNKSISFTVKVR